MKNTLIENLQKGKTPPGYNIKKSDGQALVLLQLFLPSLPGPLSSRVVAPERVLCIGQIELVDI